MTDIMNKMMDALSTPLTLEMIQEEMKQHKEWKGNGKAPAKRKTNSPGKKGGRLAANISAEEFLEKAKNLHNSKKYTEEADWLINDANELFSLEAFMESSAVKKDLSKILFDTENNSASSEYSPDPVEGNLMGFQTLDNGLHFIGFSSGGDWEWPIFVIIYWDGKSFRGFIPLSGNSINTIFNCAFGSEMDSDYGPYGCNSHLMDPKYEGIEDTDLTNQCFIDLGMEEGATYINWRAIGEAIKYRIALS